MHLQNYRFYAYCAVAILELKKWRATAGPRKK